MLLSVLRPLLRGACMLALSLGCDNKPSIPFVISSDMRLAESRSELRRRYPLSLLNHGCASALRAEGLRAGVLSYPIEI